jgi:tryptophan synthase alpha chain
MSQKAIQDRVSIRSIFENLRERKRAGFIPYITAGDRSLEQTACLVDILIEEGADILELGVPFSDPVADGPVNQRSSERALRNGTSLKEVLAFVRSLRESGKTLPIVLFTYFNPVFKMGFEAFAKAADDAGVSGVLIVDLPPEESSEYRALLQARKIDTIFLASPTSDAGRIDQIARASSGFVYYVSRAGVTGTQESLSSTLETELQRVRQRIELPIGVGFGISTPNQAAEVAGTADAVVVGSALVRLAEESEDFESVKVKFRSLARELAKAAHGDD